MKEFVFTERFEEQMEDFKEFIGHTQDIKSVSIDFKVGKAVELNQIVTKFNTISKIFDNKTEVKLNTEVDKKLDENKIIIIANMRKTYG